ncbi:LamG-like jellyroll fold domain-containing protein [Nitrosopumilus sp. S4]
MVGSKRKFGIIGISLLSILLVSSTTFSSENAFASHVNPVITTVGSVTGVKATEFTLGDAGGIFVSCDVPNTVAGNVPPSLDTPRLQIFSDSPRVLLASQSFEITSGPSVLSHTFDISDTSTFTAQKYLAGCVWQDGVDSGGDPSHNTSVSHFFDIVPVVVSNTPPTLSLKPADITVEPDAVPTAPVITATDAEDDPDPTVNFSEVVTLGTLLSGTYTLERTWDVTDSGGLSDSHTQTITVIDTIPPVLSATPADVTVEPDAVPTAPVITATDNNPEDATPAVTLDEVRTGAAFGQGDYTLTRTWSTTDASGNPTSHTQTITVIDTIPPVLSATPADVTVEPDAVPTAPVITATDNNPEDATPAVTLDEVRTGAAFGQGDYTLTRTWSTTDASGNPTSHTQTITVIDTIPPVLSATPADVTVEPDAVPTAPVITATDNNPEDATPAVTLDEVRTGAAFGQGDYTLTRTWSTTDASGNPTSHTQTITVIDTIPPVITINADPNDPYEAGTPYTDAGATATDNNPEAPPSLSDDSSLIVTEDPATLTVTYTATDPSGNTSTETRTVTVRDTTPPVLTFTIVGADRVEADETQQGDFLFSATATDSPRTTLPNVTCVDEDAVTHVNALGGQSNVAVTFGLGITTITCTADDGSNVTPEDPTEPADVDTDTADNDFIVSEIFFDTLVNTTPLWDEEITTTGTVYGFLDGEQIRVTYGDDGPTEFAIPAGSDPDAGYLWSSTHSFTSGTSATDQTISVELFSNPTFATTDSQIASIQKHPVEFQGVNDQLDIFWADPVTKSGTLFDTFAQTGVALTSTVNIDGDAIDTDNDGVHDLPLTADTDENGVFTVTGISPVIAAGLSMTTSFATNQFYEAAPIDDVDTFENLKHPTAFQNVSLMPNNQPWGASATKSGTLLDTHIGTGVPNALVEISGDGMGSFEFDFTTNTDGTFTESGNTITKTVTAPDTVPIILSYSGDDLYEPAPDDVDNYSTLIHPTTLSLLDVKSVTAGTTVTVIGSLIDNVNGETVERKPITFDVVQGEPFTIDPTETSGPILIASKEKLLVDSGILRLKQDDSILFKSPKEIVSLTLEPMGNDECKLRIVDSNERSIPLRVLNEGAERQKIPIINPDGIKRIAVEESTDSCLISEIEQKNREDIRTSSAKFLVDGEFDSLKFVTNFDSTGITPIDESDKELPFKVTASFAGDDDYGPSNIVSNPFDTTFQPESITAGASGVSNPAAILPDIGVGIIPFSCKDGDTDGDAICQEWEADYTGTAQTTAGIPFTVGTQEFFLPLPGTTVANKDLIVEIDAMVDPVSGFSHAPSAQVLTNVKNAFSNIPAPNTVNLIQTVDDSLPHQDTLQLWSGFNEIKSEFFGSSDQRLSFDASGLTTNIGSQKLLLSFEDVLTDGTNNNNNGNLNTGGSAIYISGPDGKAFDFNGSTHIVTADDPFDFADNHPFTLSMWYKTSVTGEDDLLIGKLDSSGNGYQLFLSSTTDQLRLRLGSSSSFALVDTSFVDPITSLRNNEWTHVAITYDGSGSASGVNFYIDGTIAPTKIISNKPIGNTANNEALVIGNQRSNTSFYFTGQMDDVRVYDYELVTGQVTGIFDSFVSGALSNYQFEGDLDDIVGVNDGTVNTGIPAFDSNGKIGQAFDFNGSTHIVTADDPFDFADNHPFTLSMWYKTSVTGQNDLLIGKIDSSGNGYQLFLKSDNQLRFRLGSGSSFAILDTVGVILRDNQFHHVAITYDGSGSASGVNFYIDGTIAPTKIISNKPIGNTANNEALVIGNQRSNTSFYFTGQMDDIRVYDFELTEDQVDNIVSVNTDLQSMLEISGINLTTPNTLTPDTGGATEAIISMKFDVTHATDSALNGDINANLSLDSTNFELNQNDATVSTIKHPINNNQNILAVSSPVITSTAKTSADVGTIKVPLTSDSLINTVTLRDDPTVTSTLLNAKAQAYRYVVFAHSIGGSSGQAELLGNDAIISLGEGFAETDPTHAGTEGSVSELSGTYMHELGHLLNMQHGGPAFLIDDPETSLVSTVFNCVPIQKSIMSYTGQLPGFLGSDWSLAFNENAGTLSENGLTESNGVTIPGSPLIVWGTPTSSFGNFLTGIADGNPLDWNGDLDTLDSGNYDLNDLGIAGCQSSPGQSYETFNEPDNFNFNFKDTASGQFDGFKPVLIGENTGAMNKILKLSSSDFTINPPLEIDGTEYVKAGRTIPLKFQMFEKAAEGETPVEITDARVKAVEVRDVNGTPEFTTIGYFPFVDTQYHLNWDTVRDYSQETIGVQYVVEILIQEGPDGIIDDPFTPVLESTDDIFEERVLIIPISINPTPHQVAGVGVTVLVEFK